MSDSDNYFSDSDKSERNEDKISSDIENDQESSDDEMDKETRQIIYNSLMKKKDNTDSFCRPSTVPTLKKKKVKERKPKNSSLSLIEFQKKIDDSKPKKWKSKRSQDKKSDIGMTDNNNIKKRQFNPRLPPPTFNTFKKEIKDHVLTNSDEAFPSLSNTIKNIIV
jgi:hypothetical protein